MDKLRACVQCTDWTVFAESAENVNEAADVASDYINFCVEQCIPKNTIKIYSNNKPWMTKGVKSVLNKKKIAFKTKNKEELKTEQREVKKVIMKGKEEYKNKIEKLFEKNDIRQEWERRNLMSACKRMKACGTAEGGRELCKRVEQVLRSV
ncbi:hypothetical protein ElyMa_006681200 [Elysia marginata]|uniref:Uncharacterized protein n=1 Tax=Elysia marginata TaxID=1093978 RepID=A0AAV4IMK7_9GAST|nr:hypothetical protein ElyMa_006681200 [Elysia marginata]